MLSQKAERYRYDAATCDAGSLLLTGAELSPDLGVAQSYKEDTPGVQLLHKIPTPPAA